MCDVFQKQRFFVIVVAKGKLGKKKQRQKYKKRSGKGVDIANIGAMVRCHRSRSSS
jgi:hypothetical protein